MVIGLGCWACLAGAAVLWGVLRFTADRWWFATLIQFGPRWVWAIPVVLFALAALGLRRRSLPVVGVAALIVMGPVMGLCVPWRIALRGGERSGVTVRILTCNTNWRSLRPANLAALIAAERPDIVALQEWSSDNAPSVFADGQWFLLTDRELCLASRFPIRVTQGAVLSWRASQGIVAGYEIEVPGVGAVPFYNVHLESPHNPLQAIVDHEPNAALQIENNSAHRWREAQELKRSATALGTGVLMAGDFNTPCDSTVFRHSFGAFSDAFTVAGLGYGYTYYLDGTATRIDHILAGSAWRCRRAHVAPSVGSPHRPVIAEFVLDKQVGSGHESHE